jgi:hypothetical protein
MSSSQPPSSQDVGNYQAQLDSSDNKLRTRNLFDSVPGVRHAAVHQQPRVHLKAPQLHFDTSSGFTGLASHPVEERGFASHPGQKRKFGSAFTADSDAARPCQDLRKRSRPQPVLMSQQPVQKERPLQKGPVVRKTAGLFTDPDQARRQRNLQMEMDIIEDVDNQTPHFGTPNPRVLLGKRTHGHGTAPGTSSSDARDSMSSSQRPRPSSAKSPITIDDEVSSICSR